MRGAVESHGEPMDIAAMLVSAGLGAGIGIASAALANWKKQGISEAVFQERLEAMKSELRAAKDGAEHDIKEQMIEVRATTLMLAKLQSSQDVTNVMVSKSIEAMSQRQERLDAKLNDVLTSQNMISEYLVKEKRQS